MMFPIGKFSAVCENFCQAIKASVGEALPSGKPVFDKTRPENFFGFAATRRRPISPPQS